MGGMMVSVCWANEHVPASKSTEKRKVTRYLSRRQVISALKVTKKPLRLILIGGQG
jgi:hypothetical protein